MSITFVAALKCLSMSRIVCYFSLKNVTAHALWQGWGRRWVLHHSLPMMNSLNTTETAIPQSIETLHKIRLCCSVYAHEFTSKSSFQLSDLD